MYLEINETSCCAVNEIHGLSGYRDPKKAMLAFCEERQDYGNPGNIRDPGGLITFTAVVKYKNSKKPGPSYGPDFATFIKENDLGEVAESPMAYNRINHPTHGVKLWAWAPDLKNLKKWYKKNKEVN